MENSGEAMTQTKPLEVQPAALTEVEIASVTGHLSAGRFKDRVLRALRRPDVFVYREIQQRRSNILTHPNAVYRAAYVDALNMVLALLDAAEGKP